MSPAIIRDMSIAEFNLRVMCMYNMMALRQGIDPDNPKSTNEGSAPTQENRKVSGAQAAVLLRELSEIKKGAEEKE